MKLATITEIAELTGRSFASLQSWFVYYNIKRVFFEKDTKRALYNVDEYNAVVDKVNEKKLATPHRP